MDDREIEDIAAQLRQQLLRLALREPTVPLALGLRCTLLVQLPLGGSTIAPQPSTEMPKSVPSVPVGCVVHPPLAVPPLVERATYVLCASLVLILLFSAWQPFPATVWQAADPRGPDRLPSTPHPAWPVARRRRR